MSLSVTRFVPRTSMSFTAARPLGIDAHPGGAEHDRSKAANNPTRFVVLGCAVQVERSLNRALTTKNTALGPSAIVEPASAPDIDWPLRFASRYRRAKCFIRAHAAGARARTPNEGSMPAIASRGALPRMWMWRALAPGAGRCCAATDCVSRSAVSSAGCSGGSRSPEPACRRGLDRWCVALAHGAMGVGSWRLGRSGYWGSIESMGSPLSNGRHVALCAEYVAYGFRRGSAATASDRAG